MPRKVTKKNQILVAAAKLLSEFGYRSIGIDLIVEKSNVAKMTLYSHYKSKENLVIEILKHEFEKLDQEIKNIYEVQSKKTDKPKLATINTAKELINRSDFIGLIFLNFALEAPDEKSKIYKLCKEQLTQFKKTLHRMMKADDNESKFIIQNILNATLMKRINESTTNLDYLKKILL